MMSLAIGGGVAAIMIGARGRSRSGSQQPSLAQVADRRLGAAVAGAMLCTYGVCSYLCSFFEAHSLPSKEDGDGGASEGLGAMVARVLVILAIYYGVAWLEVRHSLPFVTIGQFSLEFVVAAGKCLVAVPLFAVAVAVVMIVIVAIFDFMGADPAVLDAPIYYGVLYAPFMSLYFFLRTRLAQSSRSLLPC